MVQVVNASDLTLREVRDRLQLRVKYENHFEDFLTLSALSQEQLDALARVRESWDRYIADGVVSEGHVSVMTLSPLMWASGYFVEPRVRVSIEKRIGDIVLDDGDRVIRGRMDLAVVRNEERDRVPFCVLLVEAKNSEVHMSVGLPQLLTYGGTFLESQEFVWGLVTNGTDYQFVRMESEVYRQFPPLSLVWPDQAETMLSVLVSIRESLG